MPVIVVAGARRPLDAVPRHVTSSMIDLFSAEGEAALAGLASRRALYAFDFDGTLAPIVAEPDAAVAGERTVALLSRLATMVPTALLTGRGVDDLRRRIAFTPLHLVGNHGAEGLPDSLHRSLADSITAAGGEGDHRETVAAWLEQLPAVLVTHGLGEHIVVEPKKYSVSIHYRLALDHDAAARALTAAIAELCPLPRVIGGKCVFNILPEGAPDKGRALAALVRFERCDAALFIGDDLTDEAAFRIAEPSWVTIHVGTNDESAARFFIADQGDIERCLERILVHVEARAGL